MSRVLSQVIGGPPTRVGWSALRPTLGRGWGTPSLWRRPAVRRTLAVLAACAQLTLLLATGAEAWRGRDASAHVERGGTQLHYAHDEATCVACTAQTLHAQASRPAVALPEPAPPRAAAAELAAIKAHAPHHSSNGSRAPPLVS